MFSTGVLSSFFRLCAGGIFLCVFAASSAPVLGQEAISAFALQDTQGAVVEIATGQNEQLTVVGFLGVECPLARLYAPRLNALAAEFPKVRFIGVNSNRQDSIDDLRAYVERYDLQFPMLKDFGNEVADKFGATRTPEVFLLNGDLKVIYQGRIDDQYRPGQSRNETTQNDLRLAIEEALQGRKISRAKTEAVGCFIGRVKTTVTSTDVTYCNQIARILQQHCVECHRDGEIGPFVLDDYDEVVGWADTILEVIQDGRMPPWHANPQHGEFVNARHIPAADKELIQNWVAGGTPYGDATTLPPPVEFNTGWRLAREPDQIVSMSSTPFEVPAEGTVEYQYFVVDPGFEDDRWVTGAQILPGNSSVVHHSIVFVRPPDGSRFRGVGWLAGYVPGNLAQPFPQGSAIFVPAKSKLVFQQHYTPNGESQSDLTRIGLTFGKAEEMTHEIYTLVGIDQEFEIPPHAESHLVTAQVPELPAHAELLSIMPHMHVRGKSFRLFSRSHSQDTILLDVPQYDFNWQHAYRLAHPLPLSSVDRLDFEVCFDNSVNNPVNPNPNEHVTWGDQTWEEMAVAFFEVKELLKKPETKVDTAPPEKQAVSKELQAKMRAEADRILKRFDKNKDGVVSRFETSVAFRNAFGSIDKDRDGKLTREEIEQTARWKVQ